jgi:hypothetical protein
LSVQLALPLQLNEHEPVQVTVHFEPPPQLTLPLLPIVKVHVEFWVQSRLALSPALIEQVDPPLHLPLQLAPQLSAKQVPLGQLTPQLPASQVEVFVHPVGGAPVPPPQPARTKAISAAAIHFIDTSGIEYNFVATQGPGSKLPIQGGVPPDRTAETATSSPQFICNRGRAAKASIAAPNPL